MPVTPRASSTVPGCPTGASPTTAGAWSARLAEVPRQVGRAVARVARALARRSRWGGGAAAVAARDRVLVVDHRMPTPDRDSGSVRMLAIVKLLAELGHEVTFVAHEGGPGPAPVGLRATTILSGLAATEAHLREEGPSYRFALLCRPWPGHRFLGPVRALAPRATVIYDTVDLHWVRLTRAARLTGEAALLEEAELVRRLERGNVEGCDATLAITEPERATLLAAVPRARVEVVPNIHEVVRQRTPLDGRRDLFFIGGFEHRPNGDAVSWFAAKILPRIRERLPEVALHVVGSRPTEEVLALSSPSVRVVGHVADAAPWFERSRVFVAPLRFGSGMKGKIGQAMSFGLPVVTTGIGAEGLRIVPGEHALVADDPAAFADAVVSVYEDAARWERLSEGAWLHVGTHFSEAAARRTLAGLFPVGNGRAGARRA